MDPFESKQLKNSMKREEEKIFLKQFASSTELKNEIRQKIASHKGSDCEDLTLSNNGSFLSLIFKSKEK